MRGAGKTAVGVVLALGAVATPAAAQQWSLDARAGRLDFDMAGDVPAATSVGVGLTGVTPDGWLQLTTGVPLGAEDPLWGAVNVGSFLEVLEAGPVTLGVDASAQGYLQRYTTRVEEGPGGPFDRVVGGGTTWGRGLAARALPGVALELGPLSLRGRGGVSWYHSALGDRETGRTVPLADVRASLSLAPGLSLAADARRYMAPEGDFTFGGLTATLARPELRLWGSVGHWFADSVGVPWSAGAELPLTARVSVTADARQDVLDPLFGSAPRRAWSAGLRVALGARPAAAQPVPASYVGGRATIAVPAEDVDGAPRIAGDFTGWEPRSMTRAGDEWRYTASLEPGVYEYAFVDEDGEWFVPESVPGRKDDGMGGEVALLVVEGGSP